MKQEFWDEVTKGGTTPYQMGSLSHRIYTLDLLKERQVKSILDVGCGTGCMYELIKNTKNNYNEMMLDFESKWQFDYKGVDPSEAMIKVCKKEFPAANWEVQDALNLKEKDKSWDCVLFMHSFDYLYDYEKALMEAKRVARKYIVIVLWRTINYSKGAENRLNNSIDGDAIHDWKYAHLQEFSWEKLTDSFTSFGLNLLLKEDGEKINKEGKTNTVILLEV